MTGSIRPPQIVAMGGHSWDEPENRLLDHYILSLAPTARPRILFLGTATGDAQSYVDAFYGTYRQLPCEPSHLSLFTPSTADLRGLLLSQDIIYVGGGNTKSMLALWREWKFDAILREAWQSGIVLSGVSAGSICWFQEGVTDSIPGPLTPLPCLGFLAGSNCPHYDGEPERRPSYRRMIAEGAIGGGYATDDWVGLHFVGTRLERIVSARPEAKAYRVERENGSAQETPIQPDCLAASRNG